MKSNGSDNGKDDDGKHNNLKLVVVNKISFLALSPKKSVPIKNLNKNSEILEVLKQVKVNILLLDAIKQITSSIQPQ